ncbi:MAG: hypothetical protein ACXVBE_18065 [Bdellovibrionota bacterium]
MKNLNKAFYVLSLSFALGFSSQAHAGSAGAIAADAGISCVAAGGALAIGGALAARKMPGASVADSAREGAIIGCGLGLVIGGGSAALAGDAPKDADLNQEDSNQ